LDKGIDMSHDSTHDGKDTNRVNALGEPVIAQIVQTLRGLRYGVVSIVVQDGVIVQIERTEKPRIRRSEAS
jgi:hypothetical protein